MAIGGSEFETGLVDPQVHAGEDLLGFITAGREQGATQPLDHGGAAELEGLS